MDIRTLLRQYDLKPKRSLGQNFLADPGALDKIASAAELSRDDAVLEIGPGLGTLTAVLAQRARRVVAVEIDDRFLHPLTHILEPYANVDLVHGDILTLEPGELMGGEPYKVAANVPYYITAPILRHLVEAAARPALMVLTVQAEVAERLSARPDDMSLLAVSVQVYGQVQIVGRIKAGAFYPSPGVDSAVVRIDLRNPPPLDIADHAAFFKVVRAGFGQKRKQLKNTLSAVLGRPVSGVVAALESAGVDPSRRAETLSLAEWAAVVKALNA